MAAALAAAGLTGCATGPGRPPEAAAAPIPIREGSALTPDGIRLYYRVAGSGGPVVLAPFALFHGSSLDRLAVGRRIVTYDPRGRGRSQAAPLERVSLDHVLVDLDTIRRAMDVDQVAIIGMSGGGMESFVYALRNPGRVTRLVQLAPVAPRFEPWSAQMMADRRARTDAAARQALDARILARGFAGRQAERCRAEAAVSRPAIFHDRSKWTLVPDVCDFPNEHPETLAAYFGAFFRSIDGFNHVPSLGRVTIPRLVIHGMQDNIPLEGNREWVAGQPNARLLTIEGAGHMPHYEQPDAVLSAIDRFLDGHWPDGAVALP